MTASEKGKDGKFWFVMMDLTVEKFETFEGEPSTVTGLHDYVIRAKGNRFKTKKQATKAAGEIRNYFLKINRGGVNKSSL